MLNIVGEMTNEEATEIADYIFSNKNSSYLCQIAEEKQEFVPEVYRGTKIKKSDLKIGGIYQHWNSLSSWSLDESVSLGFGLEDFIPAELINGEKEELISVLLIAQKQKGLIVNQHIEYGCFTNEKEVIIHSGKWVINEMQKKVKDGKSYFEVHLASYPLDKRAEG
ncbi:hypothetical protein CVD28_02095 [Bacillus sp. M6-12]|uniref:hypothetical protein n=1 Tax=Bacillus sp. M6-12 TaxID=2054166 RepID=UPI000C77B729|nr:hypothetical protein [Bacillus sp. M6-12]PLS19223.1 hypothetical protein CVD28_02095 [Bacillus sp. M6-12]